MKRIISLCMFFCLLGCGKVTKSPYRIAVDPSFYPLDLMGKEANVYAFSNELLQAIAKKERLYIERVNASWDNLLEGLSKDDFDAVLSPLPPYNFNKAKYDFSKLYLPTGYILVIREDEKVRQLKKLKGREVAVQMNSEAERILSEYPDVIIRFYENPAVALEKLDQGQLDGVVMDAIPAVSFIYDRYAEKLKLGSGVLNDAGLRMVAVKDTHRDLLDRFDSGLEKLKRDGTYDKLVKKWKVSFSD
ncbi:MAG: amino acid ABC transporter substrate-binding protein [Chlamydiales bacterium]|nr:amino acid ABC transporter substrate-binding protein [Chlamydiales bacterium]